MTAVPKTIVEVEKMIPAFTITARKRYATKPNISIAMNKLNGESLSIGDDSYASFTVMLIDAKIETPDNGETWNADFTFQYRPDPKDWGQTVIAYDPKTGKPYRNITGIEDITYSGSSGSAGVPEACRRYRIYEYDDTGIFNGLDLGN